MKRSDFVIVEKKHLYGLKDGSGRSVLPCRYDKILDYDEDGYVRFIKNGCYGTVDLQGKRSIGLTAGLTHLGVFHKGTARARCDGLWGLVDVSGKQVTGFIYKSIAAHRKSGYFAVDMEGNKGILKEDGSYTPFELPQKKEAEDTPVQKLTYENPVLVTEFHFPLIGQMKNFKMHVDNALCYDINQVKLYYRDTDAPVDIKDHYKIGDFVRTDAPMYATGKLLRPVHSIRFLIASNLKIKKKEMDVTFPENSCFRVVDIQRRGGITQIVLEDYPYGAYLLGKKLKFSSRSYQSTCFLQKLKRKALLDLEFKLCNPVAGDSLDPVRCEAMYIPVGMNKNLKFNSLDTDFKDKKWSEKKFIDQKRNTLSLYIGMPPEGHLTVRDENSLSYAFRRADNPMAIRVLDNINEDTLQNIMREIVQRISGPISERLDVIIYTDKEETANRCRKAVEEEPACRQD